MPIPAKWREAKRADWRWNELFLGRIVTCSAFSLPEHIIDVYDPAGR